MGRSLSSSYLSVIMLIIFTSFISFIIIFFFFIVFNLARVFSTSHLRSELESCKAYTNIDVWDDGCESNT